MEILKLFRKLPSIKILCHCCLQRSLSKGEGCSITQGLGAQQVVKLWQLVALPLDTQCSIKGPQKGTEVLRPPSSLLLHYSSCLMAKPRERVTGI